MQSKCGRMGGKDEWSLDSLHVEGCGTARVVSVGTDSWLGWLLKY